MLYSIQPCAAQSTPEYQVKAACLYNFAKYVKWPDAVFESSGSTLNVCVLGDNPYNELLAKMDGRTAQNHVIETQILLRDSSIQQLKECHILYAGGDTQHLLKALEGELAQAHVLTVTEEKGSGIISFFIENGAIRFRIRLTQANASDLTISSQLLKLAIVD